MKLEDCELNPKSIAIAPFIRSEPEEEWVQAKNTNQIPESLYEIYRKANYLSFGTAPPFLKDNDNVLFAYFGMILRGTMLFLVDANGYLVAFTEAAAENYYPGKRLEDPTWTRKKSELSQRRSSEAFRDLLQSLTGALDCASEIIAIFSQGGIKNLQVGYSQFSRIEAWLNGPVPKLGFITTPQQDYLETLYDRLRPIVNAPPPESEWLPYLRLVRNKASHLGDTAFRFSVLRGPDERYYTFIPREWPHLFEKYMKPAGYTHAPIRDILLQTLNHQDIVEYAEGAVRKVTTLLDEALKVTAKAYTDFSNFTFNQKAFDELSDNSKSFAFEYFAGVPRS
jgi:hypothetical protein